MPHWTITHMPSMEDKKAVVTGANSGLGYQTALALARRGASVVMACRDDGRAKEALKRLLSAVPEAKDRVETRPLDLASLTSIKTFAESVTEPIDVLVNNAGLMAIPRRTTADGFEMQFGVNHLGHFALTGRLLPRLLAEGSRVVTVSSDLHRVGKINFADLMGEKRYNKWTAYGQSKLANLLFASELGRRADLVDAPIVSVAAHPGYAETNLQTGGAKMRGSKVGERLATATNKVFGQSAADGALPILYAAGGVDIVSGMYLGPDGPLIMRGKGAKPVAPAKKALDPATAKRLWDVSVDLTGVDYAELAKKKE
jgi:NAD(P)-dependent dehydrogenase (short-subunit alcohol dehydrogenase family)